MKQPIVTLWMLFFCVAIVMAQTDECPDLVEQALAATASECANLGRNEICYGNLVLEATATDDEIELNLNEPGDIESIESIASLHLSSMQIPDTWGVAIMAVQADLSDTLPGQNVMFVLFGDVVLNNQADDSFAAMQAFEFRTGIAGRQCDEAPHDGLLIQSPEGAGQITFQVNGVEVVFGSTIFIQSQPDDAVRVTALEGNVSVSASGHTIPVPPGTRASIPMSEDNTPTGVPILEAISADDIGGLPLRLLPRQVVPPPFIQPEVIETYMQINQIALSGETGVEAGFTTQNINYDFSIYTEPQFDCPDIENARPGMLVYFGYGVGTAPGELASATEAEFAGHSGQITIDGIALPTFREGITEHVGNYGDRAIAVWVATPGRHIVTAEWTHESGPFKSCDFIVTNR